MRELVQHDVASLGRGEPTDRGDLHQRKQFARLGAPGGVEGERTPAQPSTENELHLGQRRGRGRELLAYRGGDGGEVVLVGDHVHDAQ